MVLDVLGITIVIIFFIRGYMKGIIVAAFSLLAIVLGIICALKLSNTLAAWLLEKGYITSGWGQLISYVVLFLGVVILVRFIAKIIEKSVQAIFLGLVNKLAGGLIYAFMATLVWSSLLWICNQMHLIEPETIAASKTYQYFTPIASWVFDHIGKVLPFAKNIFSDLQHYFEGVNQKLPDHVGAHR